MNYERKIDFAIKLLRAIPQDGPIEISYSGGKDSDVILRLAQMAGIPHEAIYKQTSIDPPGTTAHAKAMGATIIRPKLTFLDIIRKKGTPTRRARFCCEILKEYKIYDRAVQGIRREESTKRMKNYKEPEQCRLYSNGEKVRAYFPILEWSLEDVARFINEQGIRLAPAYYDEAGAVHYERRLGCIGCPLKSDCGRADYRRYPKLLKAIIKAETDYLESHPNVRARAIMGDAYGVIFNNLFCDSREQFESRVRPDLFPEAAINPREYLSNYFGIEL